MSSQELVFLFNFNEVVYPIKITQGMSFCDGMACLKSRLNKIQGFNQTFSIDALSLKCSVGTVENVRIENDNDLECAFTLAALFNVGIVNVDVHVNEDRIGDLVGEDIEQLTDDDVMPNDMSSDDESVPDYLENYIKHGEKVLRSDAWKQAIKGVGQVFENGRRQFKLELSKCAIANGFEYTYKKNDLDRVTCECKYKDKGCNWYVHARIDRTHEYFSIRKLINSHTCNHVFRKLKDYRMGSNIIADEIRDYFDRKSTVRPTDIKDDFKNMYGLNISYSSAWRGVEIAKEAYYGQNASTYDQLRSLMSSTMKANPDSLTYLEYDVPTSRFQRFFIAYGPCIEGFKFCRPLLFLDGTFLKSRYKGHLLAATGKDANNGLYPVAIAIVDSENIDNWTWFMESLATVLKADREITFVSDRNKGLLEAVTKVFPNSPHAFCLLHLRANLKDRLGGLSKAVKSRIIYLLKKAAQTPLKEECNNCIDEMRKAGKAAVDKFLNHAPVENWANSYFKGKRYGELYSNVAESFNAWIRTERNLPVKCMIDDIRKKLMTRMAARRKRALKVTTIVCPVFISWIERAKTKGLSWIIHESDENMYEVMSNPSVTVDLQERTCTCRKWQIRNFPCSHAIAAILNIPGKDVIDYIEDYYFATNWYAAHARNILPTPTLGQEVVQPEDIIVKPPLTKIAPGRPKKNRIPPRSQQFATRRLMTCSRCGKKGNHNKKTCKAVID